MNYVESVYAVNTWTDWRTSWSLGPMLSLVVPVVSGSKAVFYGIEYGHDVFSYNPGVVNGPADLLPIAPLKTRPLALLDYSRAVGKNWTSSCIIRSECPVRAAMATTLARKAFIRSSTSDSPRSSNPKASVVIWRSSAAMCSRARRARSSVSNWGIRGSWPSAIPRACAGSLRVVRTAPRPVPGIPG